MLAQANLSSFVTYNPLTLHAETPVADAIRSMAESRIHHWPVVDDEHHLVGVFSDREIVRALTGRVPSGVAASPLENLQVERLSVGDTISEVVEFATLEETPRQVLRKLLDHKLCCLPVIQDDMVVGVTTVTDFLREFSYGQVNLSKTQVVEIMEPVETIEGEATLDEAWDVLFEQSTNCLGVVRGDFPLGVLSDRDLRLARCRATIARWLEDRPSVALFECQGPRTVLELVAAAPTIRPGERLQDAATLMLDHDRQAIAVVNQANRMMGAVTEHGILHRMLGYLN